MPQPSIDVLLNEPIATINPAIYGHFMEHLGACIYEGCWVGEEAAIPHTGGIRSDVVEALKAVRPPVIRWPGGCFADDYHWQDGIGPRHLRPRRVNMHWGDVIDDNAFGTHEFIAFCRAIGADPYLCGNVGSGSPQELRDWIEYCNYPAESEWARRRAANGSERPFGVRCWGVGNENWGCGGSFTPEDYCAQFRRFSTYLRDWGGTRLFRIACGPNGNDLDWTRRFFEKLDRDYGCGPHPQGFSAHYYTWNNGGQFGTATDYTEAQWYGLLRRALAMETLVVEQRALMDSFDPERKIGLIVDEWGTWHPPSPGRNPAFLWQQNTVRDALVAALTLDIFNRHADKVVMANIAQTINVLQALILTDGDRMLKTPTYHVYDLYKEHQGGQAVRIAVDTPEIDAAVPGKAERLPLISGSASLKEKALTLTLVNSGASESVEVRIRLTGGTAPKAVRMRALSCPGGDIHAHNTFEQPERVKAGEAVTLSPASLGTICLPPASVTCVTVE
jgi:alpha-N-arabinofuranosidase